jgi:cytochrome P450
VLKLLFSPAVFLFPYDLPIFPYHRLKQEGIQLERDLRKLIRQRRTKGLGGDDLLSMFLETHDEDSNMMTDDEVIGQTVAVFRGGSKTSASSLTWTWFLLAQHPQVLNDLLDELDSVLGGGPPTFEQVYQGLPFLEAVLKESLRLIPPVVWGTRYSTEPFELGGYCHAKGSTVVYSAHITHRRPELYKDPFRFIPSRWFDIRPSTYEFLPFSAGPRRCLGAEFAMIEMKTILAILLPRYSLTLLPNQRIDRVGITGSLPKYGIKAILGKPSRDVVKVPVKGNIHRLVELC